MIENTFPPLQGEDYGGDGYSKTAVQAHPHPALSLKEREVGCRMLINGI
jgi:hypothetical protein